MTTAEAHSDFGRMSDSRPTVTIPGVRPLHPRDPGGMTNGPKSPRIRTNGHEPEPQPDFDQCPNPDHWSQLRIRQPIQEFEVPGSTASTASMFDSSDKGGDVFAWVGFCAGV